MPINTISLRYHNQLMQELLKHFLNSETRFLHLVIAQDSHNKALEYLNSKTRETGRAWVVNLFSWAAEVYIPACGIEIFALEIKNKLHIFKVDPSACLKTYAAYYGFLLESFPEIEPYDTVEIVTEKIKAHILKGRS